MRKLKVKLKRQGTKFEIIDGLGMPFFAYDCMSVSPVDHQGFAVVEIRLEVINKNEWEHFIKKRKVFENGN